MGGSTGPSQKTETAGTISIAHQKIQKAIFTPRGIRNPDIPD